MQQDCHDALLEAQTRSLDAARLQKERGEVALDKYVNASDKAAMLDELAAKLGVTERLLHQARANEWRMHANSLKSVANEQYRASRGSSAVAAALESSVRITNAAANDCKREFFFLINRFTVEEEEDQ